MTIDVHVHCIPEGLVSALQQDPSYGIEIETLPDGHVQALIAGRVQAGPLRAELDHPTLLTDAASRLAAMDRMGVGVQLLSSWIDLSAYALEGRAASRYSRMFNELLAATAAREPSRFRALGTVPLQDPVSAARELRHGVEHLGLVGVEIATTVNGADLDDPALEPFWDAAATMGCFVLVHPYRSLRPRGLDRYFLRNLVGNPAETTVAAAHLLFSGVLTRFPGLEICLVHGGGFMPYQLGRLDRGFSAKARLVRAHLDVSPVELARSFLYDTVLHSPESLTFLVRTVGADRVVLGSDYPFEMGDLDPVTSVRSAPGLDDAERERILTGNMAAVLARLGAQPRS